MFDLITGSTERSLRERASGSIIVSVVVHFVVLILVVGLPLLRVGHELPDVPTIMAFVATPPAPPPPPPPPAPPRTVAKPATRAMPHTASVMAAPVEVPSEVKPEATTGDVGALATADSGVKGGVEGGVPGGVVGGIVGGIVSPAPPPPPPPPTLAPPVPVRIGGQLTAPALVHRVEPIYPDIAASAQIAGMVILEALVDTQGRVASVKVLRSHHPFLDNAAVDALKQWRYSPLVLNGIPTPFVLTVTFNFSVGHDRSTS